MDTTRLSSKGQIIIPKALRDAHGWLPGTAFEIEDTREGLLLRPRAAGPSTTLDDVVGCLSYEGPKISLEDMEAAVLREARRRSQQ